MSSDQQLNITRHKKKEENMTHSKEENEVAETSPEKNTGIILNKQRL